MMTLEQQRLVRYAEAMGWRRNERGCGTDSLPWYSIGGLGVFVLRAFDAKKNIWNPLTDADDALELAGKMKITFEGGGDNEKYGAWVWDGRTNRRYADTLSSAICAAVDAALAKD